MCPAILNHIICVILARCWSGLRKNWRRSAGEDVYLQGALYLLETDAAQRHALLEKLAERECTRTEEALFVLSLFDDRERGYEVMHTQLSHLFTQNRTLSLVYDFGVLE